MVGFEEYSDDKRECNVCFSSASSGTITPVAGTGDPEQSSVNQQSANSGEQVLAPAGKLPQGSIRRGGDQKEPVDFSSTFVGALTDKPLPSLNYSKLFGLPKPSFPG